jgi:hypothetical protein
MPAERCSNHTRRLRVGIELTASILLAIVTGLPASFEPAQAQSGGTSAVIETPAVWLVMPGGETSLEIRIANQETLPHQTMILLRGLPAGVELSQGRSFGANVGYCLRTGLGN